jgi:hypothetical protein
MNRQQLLDGLNLCRSASLAEEFVRQPGDSGDDRLDLTGFAALQ